MHAGNILVPFRHAVADVVAAQHEIRLRHLAGYIGGFHAGGIGKADAGIPADIGIVAQVLGGLAQALSVMLRGDAGSLVFRVYDGQIQGFGDFARELGRGPAHGAARFLCFPRRRINIGDDLPQSGYARRNRSLRFFSRRCRGSRSRLRSGCCFFDFCHNSIAPLNRIKDLERVGGEYPPAD